MRAAIAVLVLLVGVGCDPCAGLELPTLAAPRSIDGTGATLQLHLPHLGRAALNRWRGPSGRPVLTRAVRTSDGAVAEVEATPFSFTLEADATGAGLVVVGAADVVVRTPDTPLARSTGTFRLPVNLLVRSAGGVLEITGDPRVSPDVVLSDAPADPPVAATVSAVVGELAPRILAGRPLLRLRGAPTARPVIRSEGRALHLEWDAHRGALSERALRSATPSIGASAAFSMAAAELVPAAAERTVELGGSTLRARVLDTSNRRGRLWASVRLEDEGQCSWADADVPLAATLAPDGRLGLRAAGPARLVRSGGALSRSLPSRSTLTEAAAAAAGGLVDSLGGLRMTGPGGTESRGVLGRSAGGAVVLELNFADLGTPTLKPRDLTKSRDRVP